MSILTFTKYMSDFIMTESESTSLSQKFIKIKIFSTFRFQLLHYRAQKVMALSVSYWSPMEKLILHLSPVARRRTLKNNNNSSSLNKTSSLGTVPTKPSLTLKNAPLILSPLKLFTNRQFSF